MATGCKMRKVRICGRDDVDEKNAMRDARDKGASCLTVDGVAKSLGRDQLILHQQHRHSGQNIDRTTVRCFPFV